MIKINNKDPNIYINGVQAIKVYLNGQLIWPNETIILSCYHNGYWIDEYPWTDDTIWTD